MMMTSFILVPLSEEKLFQTMKIQIQFRLLPLNELNSIALSMPVDRAH